MQSLHVFDMDGTLFDTREATKLAYEAAGLPEYKPEYWGKSAAEWGCPRDIHKRKHAHYLSFANVIQPAWAYPFYEVAGGYSAVILTGAMASFCCVAKCSGSDHRLWRPRVSLERMRTRYWPLTCSPSSFQSSTLDGTVLVKWYGVVEEASK